MYYVIEDPKRVLWRGAMVTPNDAINLAARGVKMIPVDKNLMTRNAIAGVFVRDWGGGIVPHPINATRIAYGLMQIEPSHQTISWLAKIVATDQEPVAGVLRLYSDTLQAPTTLSAFGMSPAAVDLAEIPEDVIKEVIVTPNGMERTLRSWFIGGTAHVEVQATSLLGLGLWGRGQGIKIATFAISQTK